MTLLVALFLSCSDEPSTAGEGTGRWDGQDVRPALDHPFFAERDLPELSLYAMCVEGQDRPGPSLRGPYGVGNGRTFGLLGLADPLNRLHNTVGPVYDKGSRFFGDHWFTLLVDGEELPFDKECIGRPRGTSLAVTRADAGPWTLFTVDFGPMGGPSALVRVFLLAGTASGEHDLALRHHASQSLDELDGMPVERIGDERLLGLYPWEGSWAQDDEGWSLSIDDRAVLALATAEDDDALAAELESLQARTPDQWLDETVAWWQDWSARGVQVQSDDPRVEDLYDGVRSAIRVQQGALGGISPLSRYTGVWLRDTIGPTRFLLRAGRADEALDNLLYLLACHVERGDYGNACTGGLDPEQVGPEPDWDALGAWTGRTAAEGPTYVPLGWLDHARWTGDLSQVDAHWSYLRRGLVAQQMTEDGLQTFSGDETFRLMMGVAQGYPLEYGWQDLAWSANSSLLMAPAARRMAQAADRLGHDDEFTPLAQAAELALDETFWQDEGFYAPYVFHTAGTDNEAGDVAPAPFEDVNLKTLWAGALDPDDPRALQDLQALLDVAGRGDGTIQSPPDPLYLGQDLLGVRTWEGVATGMAPGYALFALTAIGAPQAEQAFDALHRYAGPSGQYPEALLYDDMSALQIYYDELGSLGDISARFRPWEGAINLDAMLSWLGGVEPTEDGMRVRPHLPGGWGSLTLTGIAAGPARATLTLQGDCGSRTLRVEAESDFTLLVELPVAAGTEGAELLPGGEAVVRYPAQDVMAGEVMEVSADW